MRQKQIERLLESAEINQSDSDAIQALIASLQELTPQSSGGVTINVEEGNLTAHNIIGNDLIQLTVQISNRTHSPDDEMDKIQTSMRETIYGQILAEWLVLLRDDAAILDSSDVELSREFLAQRLLYRLQTDHNRHVATQLARHMMSRFFLNMRWQARYESRAYLYALSVPSAIPHSLLPLQDGQRVVAAYSDGRIRIWDVAKRIIVREFAAHTGAIQTLDVLPDGETLVTGSADCTLKLWNLTNAAHFDSLAAHTHPVIQTTVINVGKRLISLDASGTLIMWDLQLKKRLATWASHQVTALTSANDEIFVGLKTGEIGRLQDGQLMGSWQAHEQAIMAICFLATQNELVSATARGEIRFWKNLHGQPTQVAAQQHALAILSLSVLADGQMVGSTSADRTIKLWDSQTKRLVQTLYGHAHYVWGVKAVRQQRLISTSSDGTIRLWDLDAHPIAWKTQGHTNTVNDIWIDGDTILTASSDQSVRRWQLATGEVEQIFDKHQRSVHAVAGVSHNLVVSGGGDKQVLVWESATEIIHKRLQGHRRYINCLAVAPSKERVAVGLDNGEVVLYDVADWEMICQWQAHRGSRKRVMAIQFINDTLLSTGGTDGHVRLWSLNETGVPRPDAQLLPRHTEWVRALVCVGEWLVSADSSGLLYFWNWQTGRYIGKVRGHRAAVHQLCALDDETHVVSVSADGTLRIWDVPQQQCRHVLQTDQQLTAVAVTSHAPPFIIAGDAGGTVQCFELLIT